MLQSLTKEANALLMAIRGSESSVGDKAYNMRYSPKGGQTFGDFSKHPAIKESVPWRTDGKKSDAAGAYQFLSSTFKPLAEKFGINDFTPQSQDKAAWLLAQIDYKKKTGNDLQTDLEAGKLKQVSSALSGTWTSLPSGAESNKQTNKFYDRYFSVLSGSSALNTVMGVINPSGALSKVVDTFRVDKPLSDAIAEKQDLTKLDNDGLFSRIAVGVTGLLLLTIGLIKLKA